MRKTYTIIVLALLIFEANAQTISGTIKDANTFERLIGVNIILNDGNGTATDFDGNYQILEDVGEHQITFKYIGYDEVVKTISLNKNEVTTLDIFLVPSSEQLSTVVVSAGRFEQKIEEITVSMEVIKPSLIENKNTTDIQTAMDQIPGVNITDGQANIRGGSGWSFGAGTRVLVMVDDMPLISGDAGCIESKGVMTVSISLFFAVQENIFIGIGFLKDATISLFDFLRSYFIFRQRSERFMLEFNKAVISSGSKSKKGAVGFLLGVFWTKNSACKFLICALVADSAIVCIRESRVV